MLDGSMQSICIFKTVESIGMNSFASFLLCSSFVGSVFDRVGISTSIFENI